MFFLFGDPVEIEKRKNELTAKEIDCQTSRYDKLLGSTRAVKKINTTENSLEEVVCRLEEEIFKFIRSEVS